MWQPLDYHVALGLIMRRSVCPGRPHASDRGELGKRCTAVHEFPSQFAIFVRPNVQDGPFRYTSKRLSVMTVMRPDGHRSCHH
jgi:hypothetical protein